MSHTLQIRRSADQGLLPLEDGHYWEGAAEEPVASQFSSATAVSDLSVTSDSGFTYTLVPDLQNRQQAVFEIRAAETMEPIRVEITNKVTDRVPSGSVR